MLKFTNRHKKLLANRPHIEIPQSHFFWTCWWMFALHGSGLRRWGEARLHRAVRRLWGLCLVGSWQTATNLTDWLFECWNKQKSPAKLRDSRGQKTRQCMQSKKRECSKWAVYNARLCADVWPQAVRIVLCSLSHLKKIRELPLCSI